jgi:ketosteroid isomerase-like protein
MPESSPTQLINDWQTAARNKDANTLGSYYTDNAVLCATEGNISTKSNIIGDFAEQFKGGFVLKEASAQSINPGTGTDPDWAWAYGQWSGTAPYPPPSGPATALSGYWSILLVNPAKSGPANWLIQQHSIVTIPPSPTR